MFFLPTILFQLVYSAHICVEAREKGGIAYFQFFGKSVFSISYTWYYTSTKVRQCALKRVGIVESYQEV